MSYSQKKEKTLAIKAAKNSDPDPEKIHKERLKHLQPEGFNSFLALYNKVWQQGYFPENV